MKQLFSRRMGLMALVAILAIGSGLYAYRALRADPFKSGPALTTAAAQNGEIALLDADFSTKPLSQGWGHRTFWGITPTDYAIKTIDSRQALHCATDNAGSILARHTSISIADFPTMAWEWKVETPLASTIDEETPEGDDHPARFFLGFESQDGTQSHAEIIWSNQRFASGDYKIINGFHHLVANGLQKNVGVWHQQEVDLMALYRKLSGRNDAPMLTVLGFFCDSDNTGGRTSAYFNDIKLKK